MTDDYQMQIPVKVQRLTPHAKIPEYKTSGAACFDIFADLSFIAGFPADPETASIFAAREGSVMVNTGVAFEIPEGWVMEVYSRSGHALKNNVRLGNCVGIIDSDYRGELKIILHADDEPGLRVQHGDRIAQGKLSRVTRVKFEEVEELTATERSTGGFGSTGR